MYNRAIFMGRLTKDPEMRQTTSGKNVTNFSIAVDRKYGNGEERKADFFNCVAWGTTAEFVQKWFTKGRSILVEGELQNRQYVDNQGVTRYITELIVDRASFTGEKREDSTAPHSSEQQPPITQPNMTYPTSQRTAPPSGQQYAQQYPQQYPQQQAQQYTGYQPMPQAPQNPAPTSSADDDYPF